MTVLRTMAFEASEDVLVLVHGRMAPSHEDWSHWIATLDERRKTHRPGGMLVVSPHGVGPNVRQRKPLNDAVKYGSYPVIVMSNHRTTRAIMTALSWFNPGTTSCREDDYDAVVAHLGLGPEWTVRLAAMVAKLERGLVLGVSDAPRL